MNANLSSCEDKIPLITDSESAMLDGAVAARPALVGSDGKFYKASVTPERPMTRG